jgi:tRNA(Glu) U13 pseudouridine synthase TruD
VSSLEIPEPANDDDDSIPQTPQDLAVALTDIWASGIEGAVDTEQKDHVLADLKSYLERTATGGDALDVDAATGGAVDNWEYVFPPITVKDARKGLHQLVKDSPLTRGKFLTDAVSAAKYLPSTMDSKAAEATEAVADAVEVTNTEDAAVPSDSKDKEEEKTSQPPARPLLHCVRLVLKSALGKRDLLSKEGKREKHYDPRGTQKQWPSAWKEYVHFTLCKMNKDTMSAVSSLSKSLNCNENKVFSYAGTKDKRAITFQRCSGFKVDPARLDRATNGGPKYIRDTMMVGDYTFSDSPISLGDLTGNRFTIILKNLKQLDAVVEDTAVVPTSTPTDLDSVVTTAVECLQTNGFVNYFGLQRFGTGSIPTPVIGKALLQGNWALAVDLIVGGEDTVAVTKEKEAKEAAAAAVKVEAEGSSTADSKMETTAADTAAPETATRAQSSPCYAARCKWRETKDARRTLALMPHWMMAECSILQGLLSQGSDRHLEALRYVPRKLLMLYLHSYQSLVWNKMVSERLRSMDKANVLVGDLVIQRNDGDLMASYAGGDAAGGDATEKVQGAGRPKTAVQGRIEAVHLVDEKDIAENKYKMTDVVLPVPGRDVRFPAHKIEDAYKSMVEGDGVRFDKNPDFFPYLSGDYRYIIQKPVDVEHSIIAYSDHNDSLTETEMTTLREPVRDTRDPAAGLAQHGLSQHLSPVVVLLSLLFPSCSS